MKAKHLFVILMIALIGLQFRTIAQINKEAAMGIVKSSLTNEELQNYNVLVFPELIQDHDFYLSPYHDLHTVYNQSWLFFIDMYPLAQWDHNCKYIFLDQQTGNYTTMNYRIPPQDYWYGWEYVNSPYPYPVNNPLQDNNHGDSNIAVKDPHKYAVFLCWKETENCRWNDLSHIYCGIKRNYGFMDENIFVLSGNGVISDTISEDLDRGFIGSDFDGPCTMDNISNVFDSLSQILTDEDILFVYATSHGGKRGQDTSYLRLWNYDSLFDYELAAMLDDIQCSQKIIGLDACYSGGFRDNFEDDHTVIQTSVSGDSVSYNNPELGFEEMTFWWGTALRGYYPYSTVYPYDNGPKIGEHDSLFTISSIDSVDFNPDDTLGGNHDGFIQFREVFNFTYRYSSDIRIRGGENYINEGFRGDLLTLNGIEGRVDTSQNISGNFLIGRKLTLTPGVVLSDSSTYQYHCNLFLNDSTEILVEDGATLNINGYYTKFIGCPGESFINIEGEVSANNMNFESDTNSKININFSNSAKSYTLASCSHMNINNNWIRKNSYGLVGFHNSDLFVLGDSTAGLTSETQLIGDNTRVQCLFNFASFPTEFHWNVIRDTIQYSYQYHPFIKTVEYDELMQDTSGVPDWRDPWCPGGGGHLKTEDIPGSIYYQAWEDISSNDYVASENGFKQVIAVYPENKYAMASLKGLYALNPALYNKLFNA
jgi:hypothetical protein